jgi:hypothetical protein
VAGPRIDERNEAELADFCEPAELRSVEQPADADSQRDIELVRDSHELAAGVERAELGES